MVSNDHMKYGGALEQSLCNLLRGGSNHVESQPLITRGHTVRQLLPCSITAQESGRNGGRLDNAGLIT